MGELFDKYVSELEESPIPGIMSGGKKAGYGDTDALIRYHAPNPIYTAVHLAEGAEEMKREYSPQHTHAFPEVNILAGQPGELVYRVTIGDEESEVESPAAIFIPAGAPHSANIVRGVGAFVVLRLMPGQVNQALEC